MRPPAVPVISRSFLRLARGFAALIRPACAVAAVVMATLVAPAATVSLPLTTSDVSKLSAGTFAGGTLVRVGVTGTGDVFNSSLQVNPDGSLLAAATAPYTFFNTGQPYAVVSGFPAGDGINRFAGNGANYDYTGSGWVFAGKQTTDTTDPAAIRTGAVVGTFSATPTRADWFQIGYGRIISIPAGGATLYVAVNDSFSSDNHGTYTVTTTPLTWNPATEYSITNGNPNGVWRYGFMDPGFTTFTAYVNSGSIPSGYRNWYGAYGDQTPSVGHTGPTNALNGVPAGQILLHPGQAQEPSILRWTAPMSATVRVVGSFHAGDSGTMQVAVRRGTNVLWTATDAGSFDLTLTVALGDTLDFTAFGGYAFGSTGLQLTISAATASLPLTVSDSNKLALGTFLGGTTLQLSVTGAGDLAGGAWPTNPDGSLASPASAPYAFANAGSAFAAVPGFPAGDGVNRFVGGGAHYDYAGTGWPFAGKQTTDTTDPAAIRFGAVVGTFAASPTRSDWFLVGTGRTIVVPAGGATLSLAVNEAFGTNNTGTYAVTYAAAAPTNDAFASAAALTGASHEISATNVGATKEGSEPSHAGNTGGASVWWTWTAPKTGVAALSTLGSTFNTLLSVYTGTAVGSLAPVASDDNSGPENTSKLTFNATAGTTYRIAVDGAAGATGTLTLHLGYAYHFSTFAGLAGTPGSTNATGTAARFSGPNDVVVDSSGNLYVGEAVSHTIRKITPAGVVTTLAGSAGLSGTANGTGADARFNQPLGLALDASGNLLVADYENHAIRQVTPAGVVTTLAGLAGTAGTDNANGASARFNFPVGLAVDSAGNVFVADAANHVIRKIAVGGAVTTFAGTMGIAGSTDATGTAAKFNKPYRLAFDTFGNLYVADTFNHTIRKITSAGVVTTLAGSVGVEGVLDGVGRAAKFNKPYGVAVDAAGNVFTADYLGFTLRKVTPSGVVSTIAGLDGIFGVLDGTGTAARFREPTGVALDASGTLFIADFKNETIRRGALAIAPVVNAISPSAALAASTVTLTGTGFLGATAVTFSGTPATSFTIVSDTTLTAVVPAAVTAGNVTVTGPGGTSTTTVAFSPNVISPTANDRFDPGADGDVLALAVQPDGKILLSGSFSTLQPFGTATAVSRTRLARLNRDGTVDLSFLATASLNAAATQITVQPDGKILLAGSFTSVNGVTRNRLARLLTDGTLDSTFDPNANGAVDALVRQPDGKILIGGTFTTLQPNGAGTSTARSRLARLLADGSLDSAFNVVFDSGGDTRVEALALQSDGAVLVGGRFSMIGEAGRVNLARFSAAGVLDTAFDPAVNGEVDRLVVLLDGRILVAGAFTAVRGQSRGNVAILSANGNVETFNPAPSSTVYDAVVQADGKIVVAGTFTNIANGTRTGLARLLPDGTLDSTFTTAANNVVRCLALQPDGSLLVGGAFTVLGGHGRNRLARVLPDGSVERALIADTGSAGVGAIAVQPDGKILLGGHFNNVAGQTRNAFARLNADSTLDTFNPAPDLSAIAPVVLPGGKLLLGGRFTTIAGQTRTGLVRFNADDSFDATFNAQLSGGIVNGVLLQPDGKFIVGGSFTSAGGQPRNRLARYLADGTLDATFNPDVNGEVFGLALQADGAIVLTGSFTTVGGTTRNRVARVSSAGVLDATFNPNADALVNLVVVQPDGKIVVTGSFANIAGAARAGVARLTASGAIDPSFAPATGTTGVYALQSDGKFLVYGTFTSAAGITATTIARLQPDGAIDPSFSPATDGGAGGMSIATQSDGKTIIGGEFTTAGGQTRARLARLNSTAPTATAITATSSTLTLTRTGPLPELAWLTFESSADGLTGWTPLGTATRVGVSAHWQLTGQTLPQGSVFYVRARGAAPTGIYAASSLVEHVQQLYLASTGPAITTQPVAATAPLGGNITLSVAAPTATSYTWVRNGNSVLGGTNATLALSPATLADIGNYYVLVNGPGGTTQSVGVTVTVTVPVPVVIASNTNVLKTPRYLATDGTDWFVSGVRADGPQAIFKFPLAGGDISTPYVGLTSPLSVAVLGSDVYWIDPNAGPNTDTKILKAPKSGVGPVTAIYTGSSVGEPLVDGSGLTTDGTVLYAADEIAGRIFKLNTDGTGFTPYASGSRFSSSFSSERLITVAHEAGILYLADAGRSGADSPAPQILSHPVAGSAFTSLVSGAPLVSPAGIAVMGGKLYISDPGAGNTIWQLPLTGGTPTVYYSGAPFQGIAGLAAHNGELYVADSAAGAIYRLAQTPASVPSITNAPVAVTTTNGASVAFSVTATGIPAVTYQWRLNGSPIPGATNATYQIPAAGSIHVGNYSVTVSNGAGSVTSTPVALSGPVVEPVFVTQPLAYISGNVGSSVTLTTSATATAGVTYQWRKHGSPLSGATNASLTLGNLTLADAGLYDVLVTTSGVGFASNASRVVVQAPVPTATVLTASTTFAPRFERNFVSFERAIRTADGKVYVTGSFSSLFGSLRPGLARLNADGSLDSTFVPAPVSHSSTFYDARVYSVAVQTDGRVLIGGRFDTVGGHPRDGLARLNLDGSVDPTFVPPSNLTNSDRVLALALQSDGKVLVAGSFNDSGVNLARLNSDGSRDSTFSIGEGVYGTVHALVLQSDGKIIIGGNFGRYRGTDVGHLARLSSTGVLDTAYRTAGGSGFDGPVNDLVLQPDGKLLVAGEFTSHGGSSRPRLARLLDTGALDTTFTIGDGFNDSVAQIALQSDGAVVLAGDFKTFNSINTEGIVRLTATGARDTTFVTSSELDSSPGFNDGTDGVALLTTGVLVLSNDSARYASPVANTGPLTRLTTLGALDSAYAPLALSAGSVYAIAPAPGGKWLVGGDFTHVNGVARKHLARLHADGSLDGDFAPAGTGFSSLVRALAVQGDGKILAGGLFATFDGTPVGRVIRLTASGARDTTFHAGTGFNQDVNALALQADGKLLVGGSFSSIDGVSRSRLVRLTATGALDVTFTQTGAGFGNSGPVNTLLVQADGRIYAGGEFITYAGTARYRLVRFLADGVLDSTFVTDTTNRIDGSVDALALQPDGKLIIGGSFASVAGVNTGSLTRLTATGARDATFAVFGTYAAVNALYLQPDGRIVVAGTFDSYGFGSYTAPLPHLARLSPTGVLEAGFVAPGFSSIPRLIQPTATGALLVAGDELVFPGTRAAGLARLDPAPLPSIVTPPATQAVAVGAAATFNVTTTGSGLTFRWTRDGVPLPGATGASYTVPSAQISDTGDYAVTLSNIFGTVTSPAVALTGTGPAPTITTQPASVSAAAGSTAQLSVSATGATAYQWRKLGAPLVGNTTAALATLTLPAATPADAALYDVFAFNGLSRTRSTAAAVTVTAGSLASPLRLDRTWRAFAESSETYGTPSRVFALPDGRYYLSGNFTSLDGQPRLGLARFLADGTLDASFTTEISDGLINAYALQPDGKLVIAGDFHRVNGIEANHLARLNVDGTLDTAFCSGPGSGTHDSIYAVALQPDGKILLGGYVSSFGDKFAGQRLIRLNADGSLDGAFATALSNGFNDSVEALGVDAAGRIFVGGRFTTFGGAAAHRFVVLDSTGARSAAYTGLTTGFNDLVTSLLVLADGRVVLAGQFTTYNDTVSRRIVRLTTTGAIDPTFTTGAGFEFGEGWASVNALGLRPDGKLIATGYFSSYAGTSANYLIRLNADGTPDTALDSRTGLNSGGAGLAVLSASDFVVIGEFNTAFGGARDRLARVTGDTLHASRVTHWGVFDGGVETIVPAPGGKWLVGGYFSRLGGARTYNIARLLGDGSLDPTFSLVDGPLYGTVRALALQGDGKILVGGDFSYYGRDSDYTSANYLLRLLPDGTRDHSFLDGDTFDSSVESLAVQADGRILVGGNFTSFRRQPATRLIRLLTDGSRDASFDLGSGFSDTTKTILVLPTGRILVGGNQRFYREGNDSALHCLNPDGTLVTAGFGLLSGSVSRFLLQPDGKILVAGRLSSYGDASVPPLFRLNADGTRDSTFALDFTLDGYNQPRVTGLGLQSDGRIVVAGDFYGVNDSDATQGLLRVTSTGALDATFEPYLYGYPEAIALRPDGSVLVVGSQLTVQGSVRQGLAAITGNLGNVPVISNQPVAASTVFGGSATFSVVATGTPAPTYQWQRNGTDLPGATNASYTVTSASQATAGLYRVIVTNAAGSVPSTAVALDVVTRNLINFYARAILAPASSITSSFTVEGTQSKTVLLVGVGGSRAAAATFTGSGGGDQIPRVGAVVSTPSGLADPRLTLADATGTTLASNDDWGTSTNTAALTTTSAQVAATPGLTTSGEGTKDAALLVTLSPGTYHVKLDGADAGGGAALLQIFDADTDGRPRLVMFTLRANVASGSGVATAGFTVDGTLSKTVLLRALGESLGYSPGVLEDPVITLFRGSQQIDRNDDTDSLGGGTAAVTAVAQAGARPFFGTLDSTLVQTLTPGVYTAQLTPFFAPNSGLVHFELFEVDAQRASTVAPVITYLTPDQLALPHRSAAFSVVTVAKPAATYQWRKGGLPLAGATRALYEISSVTTDSAGTYDVVVTSGASTLTSPPRTLTLLPEFHSADTNRDQRIGILELTRIIQLYNARADTVRTGDYHSLTGTEDGFTLGPGTRNSFHSADSNRDGRIDVIELTRIIELYNVLEGTARTGRYRPALGTEDGFAPGPEPSEVAGIPRTTGPKK